MLKLYNPRASETALFTDASSAGISGILMQKQETDGLLHPIYYVSKKTTDVEKNYHSSKLELMAVVYCIERLRNFLIGLKFTVYTDCQALVFLNMHKTQNPQIARWYTFLSEYDLELKYRPGAKMAHVDSLSRAPVTSETDTMEQINNRFEVLQTMDTDDFVLMIQNSDTRLRELIKILKKEENERSAREKHDVQGYVLRNAKLLRKTTVNNSEKLLYVIPRALRKSIVVKCHDLLGHFSVDRTVAKIRELFWFPRLKRYVRQHIAACAECLLAKIPAGKRPGELHPIPPPNKPFSRIHCDFVGPFIRREAGNM